MTLGKGKWYKRNKISIVYITINNTQLKIMKIKYHIFIRNVENESKSKICDLYKEKLKTFLINTF